jgi:hypothetical protein
LKKNPDDIVCGNHMSDGKIKIYVNGF